MLSKILAINRTRAHTSTSSSVALVSRQSAAAFRCFFTSKSVADDAGVATNEMLSEEDTSSESVPTSNRKTTSTRRNETSKRRDKSQFRHRYANYAPTLYSWTQKVVTGQVTLEKMLKSEKYRKVSHAICDTTRHSETNILNMLKSLVIIGLDPETRLVQFLENELLFKLPSLNVNLLLAAYEIYSPPNVAMSSPLRGQIVDAIHSNIADRLEATETNLSDLIGLIKISRHFSPDILVKLEDQATKFLDTNDQISLENLCYLIVLLSRHNRRNKSLIRAVVNKLIKYRVEDVYSMPPHLIHMISSLNRLNYPEVNLLEKCSDILVNLDFLETISDSSKRDFLVAIAQFNFNYPKLIDYYLQKLQEKPSLFKRQDIITLTITLARLNYHSEDFPELLSSQIIPKCSNPADFSSKYQYFNFVYSLALLRQAPAEHLKVICNKEFLDSIEQEELTNFLAKEKERAAKQAAYEAKMKAAAGTAEEEGSSEVTENDDAGSEASEALQEQQESPAQDIYQVMNLRRKYMTLAGLLLTENNGAALEGVFESDEKRKEFANYVASLDYMILKRNKDLNIFRGTVFALIENFAPRGKYMNVNKKLPYGFMIDAELLIGSEGQPQPIIAPEGQTLDETGLKRVAIMCIGFNETLLDASSQLIGPKEMEMRILRSLGYVVVPVNRNALPAGTTSVHRVKFLQNLLVSHLREAAV